MNTGQIIRKLHAYPQFVGVYAADNLPQTVEKKPSLYIVNTDVTLGSGIHWVAFYFPVSGVTEFFDSTGHSPEHYHLSFQQFLINNGSAYKFIRIRLQDFQTETCGHYCIFYSIHKCQGWSLEKIVKCFDGQTKWQNDQMMREIFPT